MPFGLHGTAATFQHLMDALLAPDEGFTLAYLDNIIMFSKTWEDHLAHLADGLQLLKDAELKINPQKSKLAFPKLEYLGYIVGHGHLKPQPSKAAAFQGASQPQTKKQLH